MAQGEHLPIDKILCHRFAKLGYRFGRFFPVG